MAAADAIARALAPELAELELAELAELANAWARFDASAAAYAAARAVVADRDDGAQLRSPFVTDRSKVFLAARAFAILNAVASPDSAASASTFANAFANAVAVA